MRYLTVIAAVAASALSLGWLWRLTPLDGLLHALGDVEVEWLLASVSATLLNLLIRGVRWAVILGRVTSSDIKIAERVTIISVGLNTLLPGKLGEVAKLGLTVRYQRLGFGEAVGGVAGERLLDLVVLLSLFGITFSLLGDSAGDQPILQDARQTADYLKYVALWGAISLIVVSRPKVNRAIRRLGLHALHPWRGGARRFLRIVLGVQRAVATLGRPGALAAALTATLLMWLISGLGLFFSAQGAITVHLSLLLAIALSAVTTLASALPSAPGGWGVYEAAGLAFLTHFYSASHTAELLALLLTVHAAQALTIIVCLPVAGFLSPWPPAGSGGLALDLPGKRQPVTMPGDARQPPQGKA